MSLSKVYPQIIPSRTISLFNIKVGYLCSTKIFIMLENGDLVQEVGLRSISTPEGHEPKWSSIIVADIMTKMKGVVEGYTNCNLYNYSCQDMSLLK